MAFHVHFIKRCSSVVINYTQWDVVLILVSAMAIIGTSIGSLADSDGANYIRVISYSMSTILYTLANTLVIIVGLLGLIIGAGRATEMLANEKLPFLSRKLYWSSLVFGITLNSFAVILYGGHLAVVEDELESSMYSSIKAVFGKSNIFQDEDVVHVWDQLQMTLSCCGVDTYQDHLYSEKKLEEEEPLPRSCCSLRTSKIGTLEADNIRQCQFDAKRKVTESRFIHSKGCYGPLIAWYKQENVMRSGAAMGALIAQSAALIFAILVPFKPHKKIMNYNTGYRKS